MKVKLIFGEYIVNEIKRFYERKGQPKPFDWNGPEFEGVTDIDWDRTFYSVHLEDGTIYRYPINSIERVKEFEQWL